MGGNAIRDIWLTNTLSGKREKLQTLEPGKLTFYSCGPTVYNHIHIGNLRAALVADLIYRAFKRFGYEVNYVRNYTDVDDKIIKRANEEGTTCDALTQRYTQEVEKDYAVAGMLEPDHKPRATQTIPEMIELIQKLIKNGTAYAVTGDVYFAIDKFPPYGALSGKPLEDLVAGARVEVNERKRNPLDFALWKAAKPGEPSWDSPWGKGRPGWHIECSAMATKWIGPRVDVHHGGEDLIFPHHENEIAQSEAATGGTFVTHWLHHKHINVDKQKMSKSLGNVFLAREFLTQYGGEVARYMMLGVHYRSIIDFSDDSVDNALVGLERIYEAKKAAKEVLSKRFGMPDLKAENAWGEFAADCQKAHGEIDDAYASDFNTAGALASVFTVVRHFNRLLADPRAAGTPSAALGAGELIKLLEQDIGDVIGVGRLDPHKFLQDLARIRSDRARAKAGDGADAGAGVPSDTEILQKIDERKAARAAKDFAASDRIRDELAARGVILKDSPPGTTWTYK